MAKLNVSDHGTEVPLQEMELLALTLLPAIQSFFESEEGKHEYDVWLKQININEVYKTTTNNALAQFDIKYPL